MGVTALCYSALHGLAASGVSRFLVFDHGRGMRTDSLATADRAVRFQRWGLINGRRYHRHENGTNLRVSARLGGFGNPGARAVLAADAILDVSGGDSFTDLYGPSRFKTITLPKRLAIETRRPLILLPQTYGPFESEHSRKTATAILCRARAAWARDDKSYRQLQLLLGEHFDPHRHRVGVDMAFTLPAIEPAAIDDRIRAWLDPNSTTPVVGLNVSGLIYNEASTSTAQFGLKCDYRKAMQELVRQLLLQSSSRVLLIPHVTKPDSHPESDVTACRHLAEAVKDGRGDRLAVMPTLVNPSEAKWIIARLHWFCGTRMHATIGALSSGIPTAALAYSDKTRGVFETCGQQEQVIDLRSNDTVAVIEKTLWSWRRRDEVKHHLRRAIPTVINLARQQMADIVEQITPLSASRIEGLSPC